MLIAGHVPVRYATDAFHAPVRYATDLKTTCHQYLIESNCEKGVFPVTSSCFREDTRITGCLRFSQRSGWGSFALLGDRLPTLRRRCIPSKRLQPITERRIIRYQNLILNYSVPFHGRCQLCGHWCNCCDSSAPHWLVLCTEFFPWQISPHTHNLSSSFFRYRQLVWHRNTSVWRSVCDVFGFSAESAWWNITAVNWTILTDSVRKLPEIGRFTAMVTSVGSGSRLELSAVIWEKAKVSVSRRAIHVLQQCVLYKQDILLVGMSSLALPTWRWRIGKRNTPTVQASKKEENGIEWE